MKPEVEDKRTPEEKLKEQFTGILEDHYQSLPEGRSKLKTDKILEEYDIVVVRKSSKP